MHAGEPGEVSNATRPWQRVAIDIVSTTTTSQDGCTKILTMIDLFTRYVIAVALKRATVKDVGTALFEHLYLQIRQAEEPAHRRRLRFHQRRPHRYVQRMGHRTHVDGRVSTTGQPRGTLPPVYEQRDDYARG